MVLGLYAESLEGAIREALARVPVNELPLPAARIADAVVERERGMPTLLARIGCSTATTSSGGCARRSRRRKSSRSCAPRIAARR
ncbi:MAG: hypothetical protein WEF50_16245, partial [Myxococcota bacterium]